MKLAVIGSGNIGKSIGSWAAKLGYEVIFSAKNENSAKAAALASGNNAKAASVRAAIEVADMVLLAVPYDSVNDLLHEVQPLLRNKILIDPTNALTPDFNGLKIGHTTSAAEEIAKLVPEAKVVKAFNTIFAPIYAAQNPNVGGKTLSVFLAGDDQAAKDKVSALVSKMGFDPVDAGPLRSARNIEPVAMLNISLGYGQKMGTNIGLSLNHS